MVRGSAWWSGLGSLGVWVLLPWGLRYAGDAALGTDYLAGAARVLKGVPVVIYPHEGQVGDPDFLVSGAPLRGGVQMMIHCVEKRIDG